MMVAYTGNSLCRSGAAAPSETETEPALVETVPTTRPAETTQPPETEATATEPDPGAILEAAAAGMDGKSIFVYDLGSGKMVYCSTEHTDKLYPASITKLFTAWLALKHLEPDTVITAGEEVRMVGAGSSLAYITPGCRLTVEMLVEAMLLPSGNDAAYVLAAAAGRAIAGDDSLGPAAAVQRFVAEMNREVGRLGMDNTNFTNPDGYHTGAHYSCPGDLALIGALAMETPLILKYTALEADSVTYASGEHITWYNTNRMVNKGTEQYCPAAVGLKTGYTGEAGYCILAAFADNQRQILIGIFGAEKNYPRYENAAALWQCCG
jgi:D-alanyl-D-alanine carboxypeptidase (penicillin-binding protein 5/6)